MVRQAEAKQGLIREGVGFIMRDGTDINELCELWGILGLVIYHHNLGQSSRTFIRLNLVCNQKWNNTHVHLYIYCKYVSYLIAK